MGYFWLFQQARCEVIVKYANCNLLVQEWTRTRTRTLESQTDEKNKNIEARQNVTGSYKKNSVFFLIQLTKEKRREGILNIKEELWISVT